MHRDTFHNCPRCRCGLDVADTRLSCGQCHGLLVPEQELLDEIGAEQAEALLVPRTDWMTGAQRPFATFVRELPPAITRSETACPRCGGAMTKHVLFDVAIDRCAGHGVWMRAEELDAILRAALAGL